MPLFRKKPRQYTSQEVEDARVFLMRKEEYDAWEKKMRSLPSTALLGSLLEKAGLPGDVCGRRYILDCLYAQRQVITGMIVGVKVWNGRSLILQTSNELLNPGSHEIKYNTNDTWCIDFMSDVINVPKPVILN